MLDGFVEEEIAVEVTHRSARRLFGLSGMVPVRNPTTSPRRPEPGRGRGRPRITPEAEAVEATPTPLPKVTHFQRPAIDYAALDAAMAECDRVVRESRQALQRLVLSDKT